MNWCQLFGCYFPADRRFSLGLPDHPRDCSSAFMVLSPLAFPPWRCARRCTRIVPLRTWDGVGGPRPTCLGCACSNRTAIAGNFRSQHSDENFALERVCRFVSRLLLGHSFGASPAPSGTRSSASHSAPLLGHGSSQNKFARQRTPCKLLSGPSEKADIRPWEPGPLAQLRPV
jgi:hypothetical protein